MLLAFLTLQYYKGRISFLIFISPLLLIILNIIQILFGEFDSYSYITFIFPIPIYSYNQRNQLERFYFLLIKLAHLCLLMIQQSLIDFNFGQPILLFVIMSIFLILKNQHERVGLLESNNNNCLEEVSHIRTVLDNEKAIDLTNGMVGIIRLSEEFQVAFQNNYAKSLLSDCQITELLSQQVYDIDKQTKSFLQEQCSSRFHSLQDFKEAIIVMTFKDILRTIKNNLLLPHSLQIYQLQGFEHLYFQVIVQSNSSFDSAFIIIVQQLSDYISFIKKKHTQTTMKQLFKSFSHELNTSLNYILALAQVAQCHEIVSKVVQEKYFLPILHCGRIMNSLVSDIMDYNLILSKQFNLEVSNFNIPTLIHEVIDLFKYQINQKKLQIQFKNNLLNYDIISDRNRIRQILINLIANSQKFTLSGQISIHVGAIVNKKQLCVVFHVKDTGIGMKAEEAERLHNLLLSGVPSSARISQNTVGFGLGLFISNKIAEVLSQARYEKGGGLRFESQYQQGFHAWFMARHQSIGPILQYSNPTPIVRLTKKIQMDTMESQISRVNAQPMRQKFSDILGIKEVKSERGFHKELSLKLRRPPVKIARELFQAAVKSENKIDIDIVNEETNDKEYECRVKYFNDKAQQQQSCGCPQILIVDDEQTNIMALTMMLEQLGYPSDSVFNGAECVNLIHSGKKKTKCHLCKVKMYRMIFMDINMPILDGIEATVQIKSKREDIVIIACTAFADTETRNLCYKSGMSYHISKPVTKDQLKEILSYYLN